MMLLRRLLLGVTAVVATAACSRSHTAHEYVIGAVAPQKLSYGIMNQRGIDLAIEEINREGGIHGQPLRVVIRNDNASGVEAARIASQFVADDKIAAVVGHAGSGAMVSAAPIYHAGKLVAVATTPSSPDLTGVSPWVFRMITSDSVNGITLAHFATSFANALGHPVRAAILYSNDAYGRGLAESFQRNFQGEVISADPVGSAADMEPFVTYYKLRKPDLVFVASDPEVGIPFLHEVRRQAFNAIFLGGDGWQGVVRDSAAEGVYIGAPFSAQQNDGAAQRFVNAFRARYGQTPDAHAALAYDATQLVAKAIMTVGDDRGKIRDYLSGLTESTAFHGVTGVTHFLPTNDPATDGFIITQVSHGMLIPVQ